MSQQSLNDFASDRTIGVILAELVKVKAEVDLLAGYIYNEMGNTAEEKESISRRLAEYMHQNRDRITTSIEKQLFDSLTQPLPDIP